MQQIPLQLLRAGESGRIVEIDGRQDVAMRLQEMGLRQGVFVRMLRPGSPCIVAFDNHRMSVRADECALVLVDLGEEGGSGNGQ